MEIYNLMGFVGIELFNFHFLNTLCFVNLLQKNKKASKVNFDLIAQHKILK